MADDTDEENKKVHVFNETSGSQAHFLWSDNLPSKWSNLLTQTINIASRLIFSLIRNASVPNGTVRRKPDIYIEACFLLLIEQLTELQYIVDGTTPPYGSNSSSRASLNARFQSILNERDQAQKTTKLLEAGSLITPEPEILLCDSLRDFISSLDIEEDE